MCQETTGSAYKIGGPFFFQTAASWGISCLRGESNHSEPYPLMLHLGGASSPNPEQEMESGILRGCWVALNRCGSVFQI